MNVASRATALLLTLALGASACGSTVRPAGGSAATMPGGPDQTALGAGTGSDALAPVGSGGHAATAAPSSPAQSTGGGTAGMQGSAATPGSGSAVGQASGGAQPGTSTPAGTTQPHAGPAGAQTPGSTEAGTPDSAGETSSSSATQGLANGEIRVGWVDLAGQEALDSFGVEGASLGDFRGLTMAMVDHLNATGGIGGRQIVPVRAEYNIADPAGYDNAYQQMCSQWTEDDEVFAAVGPILSASTTLLGCLADRDVLAVGSNQNTLSLDDYQRFPQTFGADNHMLPGNGVALVGAAAQQGYFDDGGSSPLGEPKYALLTVDIAAMHETVALAVEPLMADLGVPLDQIIYVEEQRSISDFGRQSTDVQNAVLRFRSEGITHVMILAARSDLATLFFQQADSQGYQPRYALDTNSQLTFLAANAPAGQLSRAVAGGWWPTQDVQAAQEDGNMPPRRDECLAIMESAGQSFPDRVAEGVAMDHCSHWFLLAAAVDGAGTPLSLQTAVRAIEDLGESHAGTSTYVNRFGPERHAGAAAYRPLAYDDSCECWQFTGGLSPM